MKARLCTISVITIFSLCTIACRAQEGLVAWWKFDEGSAVDSVSGIKDQIRGNFEFVEGVSGKALKFDGFTTSVVRKADKAPKLGETFAIEAWIALGAYPWNWCPVVAQEKDEKAGYYFGIDAQGHVGLRLAVDGGWVECISPELPGQKVGLELRKWYHIAGTYDSQNGITVHVDGKAVATSPARGTVEFAPDTDLLIGRNNRKIAPSHPVRDWATYPSWYSFDGIIDEVKIYDRALSAEEITAAFEGVKPKGKPDIRERRFPTVRPTGRFGACYTKLKYYDEWDALWRTSDYADIVVQFDEHPIKVMFWRGSRYSPCWVTENDKWMADQSREVGENWNLKKGPRTDMPTGCCEHMSDAQCRHSHVRLLENNDARVVVHWRYALIDVLYRQAGVDPATGWGYWADEIYTIYPDGVGVRNVLPGKGGWQETIFFNEPGTKPEDNCELEAITLVNLKGESRSYSWVKGYPKFDLAEPLIQMTNLKSKYRPFLILRPGSRMKVFNVEVRPEYSHFPWWNHWPVAQVISDGRHAQAGDRAAHSSLAWGDPKGEAALYGLTDRPAAALVPLAKSWINPPAIVSGDSWVSDDMPSGVYDYKQRAYVLTMGKKTGRVKFVLKGSDDSPIVNPAFVIKDWGDAEPMLTIDGLEFRRGRDFRYGHRHGLEGTDLIVWVKHRSTKPAEISLSRTAD